jgi:hypothetical protein
MHKQTVRYRPKADTPAAARNLFLNFLGTGWERQGHRAAIRSNLYAVVANLL